MRRSWQEWSDDLNKRLPLVFHKFEPKFNATKSIDFMLTNMKDVRWDIVAKAVKTLQENFVQKLIEDSAYVYGFSRSDPYRGLSGPRSDQR